MPWTQAQLSIMHAHSPVAIDIKQTEADLARAVTDVCCELVPGWRALPHNSIKVCVPYYRVFSAVWPQCSAGCCALITLLNLIFRRACAHHTWRCKLQAVHAEKAKLHY